MCGLVLMPCDDHTPLQPYNPNRRIGAPAAEVVGEEPPVRVATTRSMQVCMVCGGYARSVCTQTANPHHKTQMMARQLGS